MAKWQLRLEGLDDLTREQRNLAEVAVARTFTTLEERDYFLVRGTDEEACQRVKTLLSEGESWHTHQAI
jgi:hypothetical protein